MQDDGLAFISGQLERLYFLPVRRLDRVMISALCEKFYPLR